VSDDLSAPGPGATKDNWEGPPPTGTFGLMVLVGAELSELLERLVRRHASMTLAQFRMIELMADRRLRPRGRRRRTDAKTSPIGSFSTHRG